MINELLFMNGYGVYVLSAFSFTLLSFSALYLITKVQFIKEQNKFVAKFGSLNSEES
jgi:heme exporter protein D